jgi:hypothetical protein
MTWNEKHDTACDIVTGIAGHNELVKRKKVQQLLGKKKIASMKKWEDQRGLTKLKIGRDVYYRRPELVRAFAESFEN